LIVDQQSRAEPDRSEAGLAHGFGGPPAFARSRQNSSRIRIFPPAWWGNPPSFAALPHLDRLVRRKAMSSIRYAASVNSSGDNA
jgi:hypothetical protein